MEYYWLIGSFESTKLMLLFS